MLNSVSLIRRYTAAFCRAVFGQFNWNSPPWVKTVQRHKIMLAAITLLAGALVAAGYFTYRWYEAQPKPELVTAQIAVPGVTPLAKELKPEPLRIHFGIKRGDDTFEDKPVAPLANAGKVIKSGITLSPHIAGEWRWESDSELVFYPQTDWPAAQHYTIEFDNTAFAAQAQMESLKYSFKTLPLTAAIDEFKFYQDPQNPQSQQVVATIHFNFSVDPRSVEDNTLLLFQQLKANKLDTSAKRYHYVLRFDEHKRTAYLQSEALTLSNQAYYIALRLDKGIKAAAGTAKTAETVAKNVLIPDAGSMVRIENVNAAIVRNENDRPEQVLTIETALGVTSAELQKALHVYLLPPLPNGRIWNSAGQVTRSQLTADKEIKLTAAPAEQEYATLHSFKLNLEPKRELYVKIDQGMPGYGGYTLARDYTTLVTVPDYPREIAFLHKGAILALNSEKKLSVLVRGVPAVKFEIAQVLPSNINHLITQTRGDFDRPEFVNKYSFNEKNISKIAEETKEFNAENSARLHYSALDLSRFLMRGNQAQHGLFLLKAQGWNTKDNYALDTEAKRLILVTDMAMMVKDNADGSHDIFVESITQGTPAANVQVQVLGVNGEPVQTQTTAADGHAHFSSLKDFKEDREPTVYVARKDNDLSFLPYNRDDRHLNYSRFDIGGERTDLEADQLTAFLFTDRGVYRPGDAMHLGMIVRHPYAKEAAADIPVEAVIIDPRGTTVYRQKYHLPASGYLTLEYKTTESSPTGQYTVDLHIIKDGYAAGVLGSTAVNVEEFLPDRLRIRTTLLAANKQGWIQPKDLKAKVDLWNLFGTPAADRKVTGKIILKPKDFHFREYPDYHFIDPLLDPKKPPKVVTEDLTDTKTNQQGVAEFDLGLERFGKTTYELNFYAEGFEAEGGRGVAGQSAVLVSPLNYLVGYKTDGDINYIKQGSSRQVQFIALNSQLQKINVNNLQARISQLRQVSTLIKKPDGTFAYQSVQQELPVSSKAFQIAEQGAGFTLPADKIGDFVLALQDSQGLELSRVKFSIVGDSQQALPKNAELSVKLNKTEYNPGDTIELQITAPYAGAGLITLERDKVYSYRWFKMTANSSVQTIPIPADFMGNGYVNVALMRDWNSEEIFISPLSYSVQPFSVSREAHNVKIDLTVPATVQPGSPLTMTYKTDKPSKIIVYAVDEGILQVTHYEAPEPLNYFFRKQALGVTTQQTWDQILPKFILSREMSSVGGDALRNALSNYINPFKRKTDKPVVYWSGIVEADHTLRQLTYPVPEYFSGSLKVIAVAAASNAVGSAAKQLSVKGDFVLNPNVPTFAAPGDEFTVSVGVANLNGGNQPLTVNLTAAANLELLDGAVRTLTIAQGQEQPVQFKLRAKEKLGAADLIFKVSSGTKQAQQRASLSIRPASPLLTTMAAGLTKDKHKLIPIERQLYPEFRKQTVAAARSPLILVQGLHRYLENFPYSCTEQLVSKAFALIAFADQPILQLTAAAVQEKFNNLLQILRERQLPNGGFSYWPGVGEGYATQFASIYAMHFLTEAKQLGYAVPQDLLDNGMAYLKEVAAENVQSFETARLQAYAIYLLTRNELVTTDYLTNLQLALEKDYAPRWKRDITGAYIAATYEMLKKHGEAERLISGYQWKSNQDKDYNDFYKPVNSDAQYLSLLARHFPQHLQRLKQADVFSTLVNGVANNNIDTLSAAYNALALKAYEQAVSNNAPATLSISAILANNQQQLIAKLESASQAWNIPDAAKAIVVNQTDGQPYFYLISQAGFDKKLLTKEIKQGLEIYREYRDASGKKVTEAKLGAELEVHIQVRALENRYISNVAILDLLPGGFEVVRDSVKRDNVDYADIREDRVIFFTGIDGNTREIVYKIKATNLGRYTAPAITADAMYNAYVKAQSSAGRVEVK